MRDKRGLTGLLHPEVHPGLIAVGRTENTTSQPKHLFRNRNKFPLEATDGDFNGMISHERYL